MSDEEKDFHVFALQSSLFKGHPDWYFCFLKSERIAHVLLVVFEQGNFEQPDCLKECIERAMSLPSAVAHMAAGKLQPTPVLAHIFSLISLVRLLATQSVLSQDTARVLISEYETLAHKVESASQLSLFVTSNDFLVPSMLTHPSPSSSSVSTVLADRSLDQKKDIKDIFKGRSKPTQVHSERLEKILDFVRGNKGVSIKDISRISDPLIKDCSEKTIQRELAGLVRQGFIKRVGERRWSVYLPT